MLQIFATFFDIVYLIRNILIIFIINFNYMYKNILYNDKTFKKHLKDLNVLM